MTWPALRATTCLAENTEAILHDVVTRLAVTSGRSVTLDIARPAVDRQRAAVDGDVELIWACGLLTTELIAGGDLAATIVAAPVFAGQTSAVYHSVIIARPSGPASLDTAEGATLAINEAGSWSGHHGFVADLARRGTSVDVFGATITTGSHVASIRAVREGAADIAAIDHTVWDHVRRSGIADDVVVIDRTADWPAPPLSVSNAVAPDDRDALVAALLDIRPGDVDGLDRIVPAAADDYRQMRRQPAAD